MKRIFSIGLVALALVALLLVTNAPAVNAGSDPDVAKAPHAAGNGIYIVQMAEPPAASYTGGISGLAATQSAEGAKIDSSSSVVAQYVGYLDSRHSDVLAKVGGSKVYDYHYSFNGFAAKLTADQANKMRQVKGVVAVTEDSVQYADTTTTPTFLGLDDPNNGLWKQLGGPGKAGEGIIIGDIDSGIWPDSLSFTDRQGLTGNWSKTGMVVYQPVSGWHGQCVSGEQFDAKLCNNKLIGARWFDAAWGGDDALKAQRPWEFASARDYNGHGTHTASTAGGNYHVTIPATEPAAAFRYINGIAPRARIAMYKALWSTQDGSTASGYTSDLVEAIDQAVADGVDVINYSISGTLTNFLDPVEFAFAAAANSGIFVTASAGNSGPTASTVAHPSPWITTTAAGTHSRSAVGTVKTGDGSTYTGASTSAASVTAPFIEAAAAAVSGADATKVRLCYAAIDNGGTAVLDPAKVNGKIVLCDRGTTNRVNKSLAVKEAGGVGMVLVNPSANSLNADFHSVPTVHLQNSDYTAVHTYAATANATATISKATADFNTPAPFTASFSSRGPLQASGDLLKPDLIAPGQDIMAAVSPSVNGRNFDLYSGTSMSSPHVAGLAALLKNLKPKWTPMEIKSALMTSAYDVLDGPNTDTGVIFSQGAGHVRPNNAADPGLVFDSGWKDWLGFACGTQLSTSYCDQYHVPVLDPSDFNAPSIAIADLAGFQTVTRTVTNVGTTFGTYRVSATGLAGVDVKVTPATFTLIPNQKQKLQIKVTQLSAPLNAYVGGYITWNDGTHKVRIPIVVKPVALGAPAQVSGSYNVTFGYNGSFTAAPRGLIAATTFEGSVNTGDQQTFDVTVPAGTTYARFSTFDANTTPGSDLDLYVYKGSTLVGSSAGGTAEEEVNLRFSTPTPSDVTYTVLVDGFATSNPSTYTLFTWALGTSDAGNMTVGAPPTATLGQTATINLNFTGLTAGTKYLGSVVYGGVDGMPNPTIVRVDP